MNTAHRWHAVAATLLLAAGLVACTGPRPASLGQASATPTATVAAPAPTITPTAPGTEAATFASVVDGDTLTTSAGTVRLIGIDTPERGECGHDEASAAIGRLLSHGDPIALELPAGQNDQDRHGRLLRYVTTEAGIDLGAMQLEAGNAIARYDSTDGYPAHPREAAYHAAQLAMPGPDHTVITTACQSQPPARTTPPTTGAWWEQYTSCGQLKRSPNGHPTGPFHRDDPDEAEIYDWFAHRTGNNGDGDGDGLACE
ncbi:MAG: thermonuclease family protein [Propionicimonas sp.]|nr:thermonuclease family protein [Propionicimonas sp.]